MGGLYSVAFSKTSDKILACTSHDHKIYLWDHQQRRSLNALSGHKSEVNGIDFHETQHVMCSASDDKKAMIWDFQEGICLRVLDGHDAEVYGAAFLGLSNQFLVATCCFKGDSPKGRTRVFDMRDKKVISTMTDHEDDIIGIDFSTPNNILATGSDDGWVNLYDVRTWQCVQRLDTNSGTQSQNANEVKRIMFTTAGDTLAAAGSCGSVFVYGMEGQWVQKAVLDGHTDCVFDVAWGADRSGADILVSASHDHTSLVWRRNAKF